MNLDHCLDATIAGDNLKRDLHRKFAEVSSSSPLAGSLSRCCGIFLAASCALITLGMQVALIGEAIIKGIGNLFIGVFVNCDENQILKGLKQLTVTLIAAVIGLVIIVPCVIFFEIISITVNIAIAPSKYAANYGEGLAMNAIKLQKLSETNPLTRGEFTPTNNDGKTDSQALVILQLYC